MKHIKVDAYGDCLHNRDLPASVKGTLQFEKVEFLRLTSKYKFTVAMENAVCPDYITEKLWRPLRLGSVPIYFGSPSVKDWLPNDQSAILVEDFRSPKELAAFLNDLDQNDAAYEKYLDLKIGSRRVANSRLLKTMASRTWSPDKPYMNTFVDALECGVCDKMYESLLKKARNEQVASRIAPLEHYGCPEPNMFKNIKHEHKLLEYFVAQWGDEWRSARAEARAFKALVESGTSDSKLYFDFLSKEQQK